MAHGPLFLSSRFEKYVSPMVRKVFLLFLRKTPNRESPIDWYSQSAETIFVCDRGNEECPIVSERDEAPIKKKVDVWGE